MKTSWISRSFVAPLLSAVVSISCMNSASSVAKSGEPQAAAGLNEQVRLGRQLVLTHDCGGCHGGQNNPAGKGWLAGLVSPAEPFRVGACSFSNPTAKPCYATRPRNLTPDNLTGIGRFTERQIFNALRFGLRPGETPDLEITSVTPGQGNFPLHPRYLAPPMPWPSWRHMTDHELWAIATYLKHGVKPVNNRVEDSEGPPDFWADVYAHRDIGAHPAAAFPTANEQLR